MQIISKTLFLARFNYLQQLECAINCLVDSVSKTASNHLKRTMWLNRDCVEVCYHLMKSYFLSDP